MFLTVCDIIYSVWLVEEEEGKVQLLLLVPDDDLLDLLHVVVPGVPLYSSTSHPTDGGGGGEGNKQFKCKI